MEKNRAVTEGYMTVGAVAKKMGITVRTLQYYDKEGLLSPSSESEGGRRLYTGKDLVKLHQILSLKHLGFSLDDIKNRLIALETPADVINALEKQAAAIQGKMEALAESLRAIEALKAEVQQMQVVDFQRYADIIVNLQMKNEFYWIIKQFDDQTLEHMRARFDKNSGLAMMETFTRLQDEAIQLQKSGVPPESERGQNLAKAYWDMVLEFTGGDMSMLPKLMAAENFSGPDDAWTQKQAAVHSFIESALEIYFANAGFNPFEEEPQ